MKAEYINPFVESISHVFQRMLHTRLQRKRLRASGDAFEQHGQTVTSVIGISGEASGVIALVFPRSTALKLARRFFSTDSNEMNGEVTDALAELANMVAGSAKSQFNLGSPLELSLPTVIEGCDYKMRYPTKSAWIAVPFSSDAGDFDLQLSFSTERDNTPPHAPRRHANRSNPPACPIAGAARGLACDTSPHNINP